MELGPSKLVASASALLGEPPCRPRISLSRFLAFVVVVNKHLFRNRFDLVLLVLRWGLHYVAQASLELLGLSSFSHS